MGIKSENLHIFSTMDSFLGFNGKRKDPVLSGYHLGNGYRLYHPGLQRFTSPDNFSPFGAGGINPYTYCAGDPINNTDPTGHIFGVSAMFNVFMTLIDFITEGETLPLQEEGDKTIAVNKGRKADSVYLKDGLRDKDGLHKSSLGGRVSRFETTGDGVTSTVNRDTLNYNGKTFNRYSKFGGNNKAIVVGHGRFQLKKYLYGTKEIRVPENMEVNYYVRHGEKIWVGGEGNSVLNNYNNLQGVKVNEALSPIRTYREGETIKNYTMRPAASVPLGMFSGYKGEYEYDLVLPTSMVRTKDVLDVLQGNNYTEIHFLCCRGVRLTETASWI